MNPDYMTEVLETKISISHRFQGKQSLEAHRYNSIAFGKTASDSYDLAFGIMSPANMKLLRIRHSENKSYVTYAV